MIKKIYMVIALIYSAKIGIEKQSFEQFGLGLIIFGVFYLFFKIMFGVGKQQARSSGGFGRWFMSMMDTSKNDKQIINNMWARHDEEVKQNRRARQQQEKVNAQKRYKAKDDAVFYQNRADRNPDSYQGKVDQYKANRAKYGKY